MVGGWVGWVRGSSSRRSRPSTKDLPRHRPHSSPPPTLPPSPAMLLPGCCRGATTQTLPRHPSHHTTMLTCHALSGVLARHHPDAALALGVCAHPQQVQIMPIQGLSLHRVVGYWRTAGQCTLKTAEQQVQIVPSTDSPCSAESASQSARLPSGRQAAPASGTTHTQKETTAKGWAGAYIPVSQAPVLDGAAGSDAAGNVQYNENTHTTTHQHLERHLLVALHLGHQILMPLIAACVFECAVCASVGVGMWEGGHKSSCATRC